MSATSKGQIDRDRQIFGESEASLQAIVDTIPSFVWRAAPDGGKEFLNQRWHEYTGLSPAEAHGWEWKVVVHPDDLYRLVEEWQVILASRSSGEMEVRIRRFDGEYRWFLVRAVPKLDENGNIVNWFGSNTDIEDRKRAQEKVQQNELELRRIIDAIPQTIIVLNSDGRAIDANRVTLEYTGLSLEEVRAETFRERIFHPEDIQRLCVAQQNALSNGVPFENEQRALGKDGKYRWFLNRYKPLRDDQGRLVHWYATGTEIDDRKLSE